MLTLSPDPLKRREFLKIGTIAPLGLSLPTLLKATPSGKTRAKSVLLVFLGGGISHHDSFDLKPNARDTVRGKYKEISTNVPGLKIGELLPKMAKTMDKVCLVRSGSHENDHHETATNWVLSGRFGSAFGDYPAMGAVVAHKTGFDGILPPYIAVPKNPSFTWELGKSAFLGGRCESFKAGNPNDAGYRVRDLARNQSQTEKSQTRRKSLLEAVDTLTARIDGNDQLATYDEFQTRAAEMVLSPKAQDAFAIEKETDKLRDLYGRNTFGQSALLARRLIENGVRFVTVNYGGWDHHSNIFPGLDKKLPEFDQGFSTLIEDMHQRGLLEDTLVVCMGEFGRTPEINKDKGRDHWGRAGSLLFAGAGVQPGKVIGATDAEGAYVIDNPVRPADVAHTVFESLGIHPRSEIHTPDGRPISILDQGRMLHELFQG
jgi:hypothetical protein